MLTLDVPHPQLETADGAWYIAVPDGPCFDGGVNFLLGPYDSQEDAWNAHNRLRPRPCRADHSSPAGAHCDCMAVPAFREKTAR